MIFASVLLFSIGILFIALGILMWKKQMISLLHDYHYNKVREEDKASFSRLSGIGLITVGAGMIPTGIILMATESALAFIAFGTGFAVGIGMLAYAGAKYNR